MLMTLVRHENQLQPFGRLLAMRMLLGVKPKEAPIRNPYAHELNHNGTKCAEDCPACRWVAERQKQQA